MEDYSPSPDEVEETPLKRRRFLRGNFLRSWLEHRRDDNVKEPTEARNSTSETAETDVDWRPERVRDKLRNIFRGLVGLELVPAAALESLPSDNQTKVFDYLPREDLEPSSEEQSAEEDGLLAVSADAQRRYYGQELPEEAARLDNEPEVEVDDIETDHPSEHYLPPVPIENIAQTPVPVERRPSNISAEPVGEVLRRQQAERLERKVKKLNKEAKTIKREQAEVIDKQQDFAKRLEAQQAAQRRFEKVTVPKMEKARQQLQTRLDGPPALRQETAPAVTAEIAQTKPVEVKSEFVTEATAETKLETTALQELTKAEHEVKPEELQHTIELAAEQNVPIESLYERRHEVKDRADANIHQTGGSSAPSPTSQPPVPKYPPPIIPAIQHSVSQATPANVPVIQSPKPANDLYKRAAQTGFWTAIAITIAAALILLVTR